MYSKKPQPIMFTREGLQKAQQEFDRLTSERAEVLIRLQAAREMGDLSENGAYHAAKFELGTIDRQLRRLTYQLRFGQVASTSNSGRIEFGSTVTLDDGKHQMTFMLVGGFESDPKNHKLSTVSPIGKSVVGKSLGDKVVVKAPAGEVVYTVIKVE